MPLFYHPDHQRHEEPLIDVINKDIEAGFNLSVTSPVALAGPGNTPDGLQSGVLVSRQTQEHPTPSGLDGLTQHQLALLVRNSATSLHQLDYFVG